MVSMRAETEDRPVWGRNRLGCTVLPDGVHESQNRRVPAGGWAQHLLRSAKTVCVTSGWTSIKDEKGRGLGVDPIEDPWYSSAVLQLLPLSMRAKLGHGP